MPGNFSEAPCWGFIPVVGGLTLFLQNDGTYGTIIICPKKHCGFFGIFIFAEISTTILPTTEIFGFGRNFYNPTILYEGIIISKLADSAVSMKHSASEYSASSDLAKSNMGGVNLRLCICDLQMTTICDLWAI